MAVAVDRETRAQTADAPAVRAPDGPYRRGRDGAAQVEHAQRIEAAYRRHYTTLVQICRERTADPSRAEDLAQETVLRALRYAHTYDPSRPILPWLRTIAVRVVIDDAARAASRRERAVDPDTGHNLVAEDRVDEEALARVAGGAALGRALRTLPRAQQVALRLRYLEDWSGGDTARFLGISRAACDQAVARAKRRLREQLDQLGEAIPALVPLPVARAVARLRLWVHQRRASATTWELGLPSAATIADTMAVAVAVAIAIVSSGLGGPGAASADPADADAVPRSAAIAMVMDPTRPAAAQGGPEQSAKPQDREPSDGNVVSQAADGSSRYYRLRPPADGGLEQAPPTRAEAGVEEDPEQATVEAEVTVSALGYDVEIVNASATAPCERVYATSGTTCWTVGTAVASLPEEDGVTSSAVLAAGRG